MRNLVVIGATALVLALGVAQASAEKGNGAPALPAFNAQASSAQSVQTSGAPFIAPNDYSH
jgi:hypothetical protein